MFSKNIVRATDPVPSVSPLLRRSAKAGRTQPPPSSVGGWCSAASSIVAGVPEAIINLSSRHIPSSPDAMVEVLLSSSSLEDSSKIIMQKVPSRTFRIAKLAWISRQVRSVCYCPPGVSCVPQQCGCQQSMLFVPLPYFVGLQWLAKLGPNRRQFGAGCRPPLR